jgi:hypothetical protein
MAAHQHLSCVLLSEPQPLDPAAISDCHKNLFAAAALTIGTTPNGDFTKLRTDVGTTTYVAAMPAPVPNGEAETHYRHSLESILGAAEVKPHAAHILVITRTEAPTSLDSLKTHLRNTAAVANAHQAVAVYDGAAGATHSADFYLEQLERDEIPVAIISGFSVANEGKDRLSFLTLGLRQLHIKELLVEVPRDNWDEGMDFVLNLASYVIGRGQQIPDGDTVGYSETQRIQVTYRSSPIDEKQQVAFLALPLRGDA